MTSRDISGLEQARMAIPPGTRLHVAFFDSEDLAMRQRTVRAVRRSGFVAVPIVAARRLRSVGFLSEFLANDGYRDLLDGKNIPGVIIHEH